MYSILPIEEQDLDILLALIDEVFDHVQKNTSSWVGLISDWDASVKMVREDTGEIIGFYFFNEEQQQTLHGQGLQGVAIGLKAEYRGKGLGKRLIQYPYEQLDYDYIWGHHLKTLNNLADWQKRRRWIGEQGNVYVTAGSLKGNPLKVVQEFPYHSQPDGYSCGCTVIRMVMDKLEIHPEESIPAIGAVCGTDSVTGTTDEKMKNGLAHYGISHEQNPTRGEEKEQLDWLNALLDKGQVFGLRGLVDGIKHWYLVFDRNEDYYYLNDPWLGRLVYHKDELLETWKPRAYDGFAIKL
jgi:GNAT superfamily N-acetyltransferase